MTQLAHHQPDNRWYAVRTKPRQESRARANLENQGFVVYLPHAWVHKRQAGHWQRVREVLFPGYLFIAVEAHRQAMAPIRSTPGVLDLVRRAGQPQPVPDDIVQQLQAAERKLEGEQAAPHPFQPGDALTIVAGPLKGLAGVFHMARSMDRVTVLVRLLGAEKSVELNIDCLAPNGC